MKFSILRESNNSFKSIVVDHLESQIDQLLIKIRSEVVEFGSVQQESLKALSGLNKLVSFMDEITVIETSEIIHVLKLSNMIQEEGFGYKVIDPVGTGKVLEDMIYYLHLFR